MDGWVCDVCGKLTTGAMCMACGRQRPIVAPSISQPGSYWSILGLHTAEGFRGYGLWLGLLLLPVLLFYFSRPSFWLVWLVGGIMLIALGRQMVPMLVAKFRFRDRS